jgi:hypothetical protein
MGFKFLVNLPEVENLALRNNWVDLFNAESVEGDADSALGNYRDPYADPNILSSVPGFSGLGPLLGALYAFNVTRMLDDENFALQAARVKGKFFTESLHEALGSLEAVGAQVVKGETIVVEERIMVLRDIGIALATLLLISFLLLVTVF